MECKQAIALLETALGTIGIAWTQHGLCRLRLPDGDAEQALAGLRRAFPKAEMAPAPGEIAGLLVRYAKGETVDFKSLAVDLPDLDAFRTAIHEAARRLGYGETLTYGDLAKAAGYPGAARETGEALGRNPVPIVIPCHRIVAAGGKLGGFSAPGGADTKKKLLALERARFAGQRGQASFAF